MIRDGMNFLVFLGSRRESWPPKPVRLGSRVAKACETRLAQRGERPELVDPMDFNLSPVFKPHFAYPPGDAPADLEGLAEKIDRADGYVMVSPEYNHSFSPALADLLNHFGSSLFSFKPSLIVTYSAGQWGGARAAIAMRPFLSELGCLPVSAMIHVPQAQTVFHEDGSPVDPASEERWTAYLDRGLDQLRWWAAAASHQRHSAEIPKTAAFRGTPGDRNAPSR